MPRQRRLLKFAEVGSPKTYYFRLIVDGEPRNLDTPVDYSIIANAVDPLGAYYVPTVTVSTQVDSGVGQWTVFFPAANFTIARIGQWYMSVRIGTSGLEEPVDTEYVFWLYPRVTLA